MKQANEIKITPELIEKIGACASAEELVLLAKKNEVELSTQEAEKILQEMGRDLSEEELAKIAGGESKWWYPCQGFCSSNS